MLSTFRKNIIPSTSGSGCLFLRKVGNIADSLNKYRLKNLDGIKSVIACSSSRYEIYDKLFDVRTAVTY